MNDTDLINEREKVFEHYRQLAKKRNNLEDLIKKQKTDLFILQESLSDINRDTNKVAKLIELMIVHDCDPVEAKLKYEDIIENENNKTEPAASTSAGYNGLSVGSLLYKSNILKV